MIPDRRTLPPEERDRIGFGIRRINGQGREVWIPATYSRVSDLMAMENGQNETFRHMANLAVAEVETVAQD